MEYCSFISNINSGKVSFELCFSFKVLCWLFILKLLPYKPLWNKDQWTTELAIKGSLILNITHVWTRGFFSLIGLVLISKNDTVEPWHNKVLGVTYNFLYPSNSKIYGKEPWYDSPLPPQHIEVPLLYIIVFLPMASFFCTFSLYLATSCLFFVCLFLWFF